MNSTSGLAAGASAGTTRPEGINVSVAAAGEGSGIFVIRVDGTIDTLTSGELDLVIGSMLRQERFRLVIDLAGTSYISSAGWGIFVSRLREAREGRGDVVLARMVPTVREVYELLELDGVLRCFESLDDARAHLGGNGHGRPVPTGIERRPPAPDQPLSPAPPTVDSVEAAVLHLVLEDPFYTIREMRERLKEIGDFQAGRLGIWRVLRRHHLVFRHRRFRFYRQQAGSARDPR